MLIKNQQSSLKTHTIVVKHNQMPTTQDNTHNGKNKIKSTSQHYTTLQNHMDSQLHAQTIKYQTEIAHLPPYNLIINKDKKNIHITFSQGQQSATWKRSMHQKPLPIKTSPHDHVPFSPALVAIYLQKSRNLEKLKEKRSSILHSHKHNKQTAKLGNTKILLPLPASFTALPPPPLSIITTPPSREREMK